MKVGIACDHGAFEYKEILKIYLTEKGNEVIDYGTFAKASVDYSDYAEKASNGLLNQECDFAIVMCGTGVGVSITANKIDGIRCALCADPLTAKLTRAHNNSNVLAMGARIIGVELMKEIVDNFLATPFSFEQRHQQRIDKISDLEKRRKQ